MPGTNTPVEALLAAIVESSDDAIISKDLNGIITSWNRGAERIFGYEVAEAIGNPITIIATPARRNEMPAILERIKRGEQISHYETIRRRKDGEDINISLTVSPIRNESGVIVGASKIARDITERKLAEEAILRQSERLTRANADLQQFAYVTSHDLQEPLRTIQACTELFMRKSGDKLESSERELLELVINASKRMTGLIGDLLTYSRSHDEERPFSLVQTADVVEWAVNNLDLAIRSTHAEVIRQRENLPAVRGNHIALVQVFQNLISNAIKYRSGEPPRIQITAEKRDDMWLFSVRDNGIGIAPAYHKRVFLLFQRLHTSQEYPGTGIGLAVCRKIVQSHGGEIWVESEAGHGSTFKFTIPAEEGA
ncbi:MAG: PAS domain S-box protein [Acidobacteriota bacterium]|nr:PAS domain S-box protein [Acidobacteriota bacterium]